jgi:hypothetical protein
VCVVVVVALVPLPAMFIYTVVLDAERAEEEDVRASKDSTVLHLPYGTARAQRWCPTHWEGEVEIVQLPSKVLEYNRVNFSTKRYQTDETWW